MGSGILLRRSISLNKRIVHSLAALPTIFTASASSFSSVSRNAHFAPRIRDSTADADDVAAPKRPSSLIFDRSLHSGLALSAAHGFAVADYSDDDKYVDPSAGEGLEISKLGISNDIVSALAAKGITKLFPIQKAVLQPAMQGRDMIGRARTGTGKTLAFGIPVLDKIISYNEKHGKGRNPLAIVLAPTRELAKQVDKEFYESAPSVDTLCVYGGSPIQAQMSTLDRGVDVVVGTPGRVIDLLKRGALNLSEVQFVILDEADQMLNVGFADAVETILEHIRQDHQTMMFSATMPAWILKLTQKFLKNPLHVDLVGSSDQKLADGITLYSIAAESRDKAGIIGPLIREHAKGGKSIVFTQTKRDADRLAFFMSKSIKCEALHGDITQNQRERTLAGFRDGRFDVLVATDVAARGLDVPNVDLVIHYELPNSSEIFVHRTGRTGRAGKKGSAILVHSSSQYRDLKGIEREVGCRFSELPQIASEGGSMDMYSGGGNGGRFSSFGNPGGGRFNGSGRSSSFGGGYGSRDGGYNASNSSRSGSFGSYGSDRSSSFGGPSRGSDRNSGFGKFGSSNSGSSDGFGSFGSGKSSRSSFFGNDKY